MTIRESRLYYDSPCLTSFSARIVSCQPDGDYIRVVLDRTAFYPTSGGQPNDTGAIAGARVLDVVENGEAVVHITEPSPSLKPGFEVECEINAARRTDHMQQHSGQHILSAAFEKLFGAKTVGFHLGEDYSTIDLDIPELNWAMVERVDTAANRVILENRPITVRWVTREEVEGLNLRKPTDRDKDIRIVEVQEFDISACGGTHPRYTGEIGLVKVLKWERIRRDTRVYFVCGQRAVREFGLRNRVLTETAALLSSAPEATADAVRRLMDQVKSLSRDLKAVKDENLTYLARDLNSEAVEVLQRAESQTARVVVKALHGRAPEEVKSLASILTQNKGSIALLAGITETAYLVFARSGDLNVNMGQILKETLPMVDGKGGGAPHFAQGGGPNTQGVKAALATAAAVVREALGD